MALCGFPDICVNGGRMEHCAGRSVHLTPSGLDFDEQRVQLVRSRPPCSLRCDKCKRPLMSPTSSLCCFLRKTNEKDSCMP